jgi:hypothetical protein
MEADGVCQAVAATTAATTGTPRGRTTTRYAARVKRLRAFLERLPGGHRPPTGPLTTTEATDAEKLRQETLATDNERMEQEQDEASARRDREVPLG